jgi:FKBP-type peptidyl-prolyl cis-trans isomerase FklB
MTIRTLKARWVAVAVLGTLSAHTYAADNDPLSDPKKKISYSVGMSIGGAWKNQDVEFDVETVAQGIRDQLAGKTLLTEAESRQVMMTFSTELRTKQEEKRKALGDKNAADGAKFLAENKSKPGVVTLPSGLQYTILQEGKGEIPKSTDRVSCNYKGTLLDGTEFDSSYKNNKPAEFAVTGVIKGWTEALQLMKAGSKWQLFIPSELAYGPMGRMPKIGPNAVLVFELELLAVIPAPATPPAPSGAQPAVTSDIIKVPSADDLKKGAKIEVIKADDAERLQKEREQQKKDK